MAPSRADVTLGQAAPNVSGKLVDGQPYSLSASKGKVVLINFWASWCEPCREEMPMIEEFLQKNKANGFEVLSVDMDKPSGFDAAKQIMKKYSFQFAWKNDLQYSGLGYVWRIPSTFIIDKEGIVRKNGLTGEAKVNTQILEESITPLLRAQLN
jgi:thiol-disulfide isomerase/thioredoxin